MQYFYLYYGTTFCIKLETLVIIRFLFFYPIKIDILVTFERKTTEHGLRSLSAPFQSFAAFLTLL